MSHARLNIPRCRMVGPRRVQVPMPVVDEVGDLIIVPCGWWATTKRRPSTIRAERHAANRRARASRKANRP